MSKTQLQVYKAEDFKEADRLGRMLMYMIEPERAEFQLNHEDEVYYGQLLRAYQNCYGHLRRSVSIRWIQEHIPRCESPYKANRVFADMQQLFGHFIDKNKELQKQALIERLYLHAEKIEAAAEKLEAEEKWEPAAYLRERAASVLEKAAKMEGLDQIEDGFDPSEFELPEIEVTSDPAVLVEDVDCEVVE